VFRDFMRPRLIVCYRHFGSAYQSHLQWSNNPRRMLGMLRYAVI